MTPPIASADAYAWALARAFAWLGQPRREHLIKLYQVFAQNEVTEASRRDILKAIAVHPGRLAERPVSPDLLANKDQSIALARDYMLLLAASETAGGAGGTGTAYDDLVRPFLTAAGIGADQIKVLEDWVKLEIKALRAMGAGEAWMADEKDWRELGTAAAGVGLPVAALYFAGITGFSAVGLSSGLAAIGGGAAGAVLVALGLNPMTAGIAVLIVGGIAIKKIADYALGVKSKKAAQEEHARQVGLVVNIVGLLAADREALPALVGEVIDPRPTDTVRQAMADAADGLRRYAAQGKVKV